MLITYERCKMGWNSVSNTVLKCLKYSLTLEVLSSRSLYGIFEFKCRSSEEVSTSKLCVLAEWNIVCQGHEDVTFIGYINETDSSGFEVVVKVKSLSWEEVLG